MDAIGRFLTKLKKPSNYDKSIVEEINKFNLKNHINDFANSITESLVQKFDTCTIIKLLAAVWVTYTDEELRRNVLTSLETVLVDKKLEGLNKTQGGPEIRASIFRLFFELHMMGFGNSLKLLVQAFNGCVGCEANMKFKQLLASPPQTTVAGVQPQPTNPVPNKESPQSNGITAEIQEMLSLLPLTNMFTEEMASPFLGLQSELLAELCPERPRELEDSPLNDEQRKFFVKILEKTQKKLEDALAKVNIEKGRREEELYELHKKGIETPAEKKERYTQICGYFDQLRHSLVL